MFRVQDGLGAFLEFGLQSLSRFLGFFVFYFWSSGSPDIEV